MTKATKTCVVSGDVPGAGKLYAAVDPSARYVTPLPCAMRFAALLAPFPSVEAAQAALAAAGAMLAEGGSR